MGPDTILIILGALLILVGIIGGGFEIKEAKIPKVGLVPRILALVIGIAVVGSQIYPRNFPGNTGINDSTTPSGVPDTAVSKQEDSGSSRGSQEPDSESQPNTGTTPGPLALDAAFVLESNGKTYTFIGRKYSRYSSGQRDTDPRYPTDLPGGWKGLPSSWHSGIDAALYFPPNGKGYLFKGSEYARLTGTKVDPKYPTNLPGGWQGLPLQWHKGIDAALFFKPNGKSYFFRGHQYIRLTGTIVDAGYPTDLPGGWNGLPTSWSQGIDAAIFRNGKPYFFRGSEYIRFTGTQKDSGYPKSIVGNWPEN